MDLAFGACSSSIFLAANILFVDNGKCKVRQLLKRLRKMVDEVIAYDRRIYEKSPNWRRKL
ncbi:hypothetical protein M8C21_028293 [Ambrosia artemisiifolia]|uniref:Uncharacterized protein n=1 Tax=Ambrosia artemisiifolia TaxID=4212 RepID=A0AAD5G5L9_AMBAR|nr:hypothetical protein M8C21_028293 [Ambrosia artemisiifolia]